MRQADKLEQLRTALEEYAAGHGPSLFDYEAEEAKAAVRKRALGLLDQRARSRHELTQRLLQAEFPAEVVDSVVDDLAEVGLINDQLFAFEWVRQRHARRGKSTRVLEQELSDKGVDPATRTEALAQIDSEDEAVMARMLAAKKARGVKHAPADRAERDKTLRRIVGVLARRGFPQGMSLNIAREALDHRIAELED